MKIIDIAIIGFGATGVGLLNAIQSEVYNHKNLRPSVAIFNNKDSFSKGKAFGDSASSHIVNTPPSMMSASSLDPEDFSRWLKKINPEVTRWPPRAEFSKYLKSTYDDITNNGLVDISEFKIDVINLSKVGSEFELDLQDGQMVKAREVVMCLGSINANNFSSISQHDGFIRHHANYKDTKYSNVLIAGSGLSAIDAFRYINRENQNTCVNMFSRTGLAPTCLAESNQYNPKYLNWNSILKEKNCRPLRAFIRLINKEKRALGGKGEFQHATELFNSGKQYEYFEYLQTRASNADLPWQDVLVSTRPWFHKLWKSMSLKEKSFFLKEYSSLWATWRHPIPSSSFSQLKNAVNTKHLRFYKSTKLPLYKNNTFSVETTKGELKSDTLWDGTGGTPQLPQIDNLLIKNLLLKNYIEPHPCGGLMINPKTFAIRSRAQEISGLYNIGPLNKGTLFSTNAFWFNSKCAESWVHNWLKRFEIIMNTKERHTC